MRIGIFGGSFDPIHYGHLILAESCREQANLDQVWFVPSNVQPHKPEGPRATDRQRCEMIELALAGHTAFILSKIELERDGTSFTVDTLREISQSNPDDELFFLMGADSLASFDQWHTPDEILELATPLIVNRPSQEDWKGNVDYSKLESLVSEERLAAFKEMAVNNPLIEISSSNIRQRVNEQMSIRFLTPRSVEKFVQTKKLYQ